MPNPNLFPNLACLSDLDLYDLASGVASNVFDDAVVELRASGVDGRDAVRRAHGRAQRALKKTFLALCVARRFPATSLASLN